MSGELSSAAEWFTRIEPVEPSTDQPRRPDDPRLGEITQFWRGDSIPIEPGRAVLIGFAVDEGVRRNHGRIGAAAAPDAIRRWLYRLTPCDCLAEADLSDAPPLDLGNLRMTGDLEDAQQALAQLVAPLLQAGAIPVILGGGHETAFGHFLGYVQAAKPVSILNVDAHLDVRPCIDDLGHSGSPFRQAMEHPVRPLPGQRYTCLGAQPHYVSRPHLEYVLKRGGVVRWCEEVRQAMADQFRRELGRLEAPGWSIYVSVDADAVRAADVPGVSAPNATGLPGEALLTCARLAGSCQGVSSFDLVEINPRLDRDDQSARWGALVIWNFLLGLATRHRLQMPLTDT
jgi:formiminoglutamase